ncbi:MAG TPA: NADH-quinone oxidoreductase subunit L [Armatimonadetes bacterium]|nr:NADH-quinone oxidoreductase subunit L [Armatimonadota bacterium]
MAHVWCIPLWPLLAFVVAILFGGRYLRERTPYVVIGAMGLSTFFSWWAFLEVLGRHFRRLGPATLDVSFAWAPFGDRPLELGYLVDPLGAATLAVVSVVITVIQIYSIGYMHGDPRYARFFAYLSLFATGMLGLVVSNNFLTFLLSWEIMGLCSYLLIGFWFERPSAMRAAKKAFIVTRLGDLGLYAALMLMFGYFGDFRFAPIFEAYERTFGEPGGLESAGQILPHAVAVALPLLLFWAAMGKSAQFPLHVWLPDAMEGPTPVSALIHAATMVAAGVFLVARAYPLFFLVPPYLFNVRLFGELYGITLNPLLTVASIGGFTALFAAIIAVLATDIKRVLAYSTISQLGYMMLGLGVGGYTAGIFHLFTHACFKALLFLGSGSVIHGAGVQDMWQMGGLRKKMPVTFWTFLCGMLALAGIFPFAGFWSKDEILLEATKYGVLFAFGLTGAFLTAFYMTRLMMLTFFGRPRDLSAYEHAHESPWVMLGPLVMLAVLSLFGGFVGTPWANWMHEFVHYERAQAAKPQLALMVLSTLIALGGVFCGALLYWEPMLPFRQRVITFLRPLYVVVKNKFYIDEIWWGLLVVPLFVFMQVMAWIDQRVIDLTVNLIGWATVVVSRAWGWFDLHVVDGLVNLIGWLTKGAGEMVKFVQTGRVQTYATILFWALLAIIIVRLLVGEPIGP